MNNLITIKTATFQSELDVAMSYLEDNDVKCHLKDEYFAQVHPAATTQGVQLQVAEEDVEKALKLLIEGGFATVDEYKEYSDPLTRFVDKIIDAFKGGKE